MNPKGYLCASSTHSIIHACTVSPLKAVFVSHAIMPHPYVVNVSFADYAIENLRSKRSF